MISPLRSNSFIFPSNFPLFFATVQRSLSLFLLEESSNFETKLAQKFPMIKSYSAQGIDDPTSAAKISIGLDGFHAVIFSGQEETYYIHPYSKDSKTLMVYKKPHLVPDKDDFTCQVEAFRSKSVAQENSIQNVNDGKLRTFRLQFKNVLLRIMNIFFKSMNILLKIGNILFKITNIVFKLKTFCLKL
mgnify:CR=1 FL=1